MSRHKHNYVNENDESLIAFGLNRDCDESSLISFMQKFSDDDLMKLLVKRLSDEEIEQMVDMVTALLRKHLSEQEYHRYFLKD